MRGAEKAIGRADYSLTEKQRKGRNFSRSLYVVEDIKEGDEITCQNVRSIRPDFGLHLKFLPQVLGKKASKRIGRGTALAFNQLMSQIEFFDLYFNRYRSKD